MKRIWITLVIGKRIWITLVIGLIFCLVAFAANESPKADKNSIADPNAIKLPEGAKMPIQLKCPVHGVIGNNIIVIETDTGKKIYCARCAKTFISKVFELNLPKLEVVK